MSEVPADHGSRPEILSIVEILGGQSCSFRDQIVEVIGRRKPSGIGQEAAEFRLVLSGDRHIGAIQLRQVGFR